MKIVPNKRAGKGFPFPGLALLLATFMVAAFVFLGLCLHAREIAGARLFLVQRQLLGFVSADSEKPAGEGRKPVVMPRWRAVDKLVLLQNGGRYAGQRIKPLDDPYLLELLHDGLALRTRFLQAKPGLAGELVAARRFQRKLAALADALALQAAAAGRRAGLAFWLLVIVGILLGTITVFWLLDYNQQRRHQDHRLQVFVLRAAMLKSLPEAWFLLDGDLQLQAATNQAAALLDISTETGSSFYQVCRDAEVMAGLRRVAAEIKIHPVGKIEGIPERVVCEAKPGNSKREVLISWYRVVLAGQDYLLGRISDAEAGFLESTDSLAARRLRELAEKFFKVQDEERRRLADELHDGLCQALAVLKMQVSAVERRVEAEPLKDECRQARRYVTQIIEDVRRLSHDLSPVILDDLGLSEALVHLVNNFTASHNIKALTSVPDIDDCLSENEARNIYRIVQEAINNVGKHAKATQMLLEVERQGGRIRFLIRDDGVGFDTSRTGRQPLKTGLGMASMAQRVELMGGEFKVVSRPGQGTDVIFELLDKAWKTDGRFT